MTMAGNFKLTYFNTRGRAEQIRLIFAAGNIKYEDKRINKEEWEKFKPETPFGGIPVLEHEGRILGQSQAISRYVARQAGLAGDTPSDEALVDSVAETAIEIRENYLIPIVFAKDEEKKAELTKKLKEEVLPKTLGSFDKILQAQDYFVNNKLSWADLVFYHIVEYLDEFEFGEEVNKFPKLRELFKRVAKNPGVAEHLKTRPQTK